MPAGKGISEKITFIFLKALEKLWFAVLKLPVGLSFD